jgi:Acetyltransferase (GNAT) domain
MTTTTSSRSLATAIEERLLVPAYASRFRLASVVAHRSLALPLQLVGQLRRRTVRLDDQPLQLVEIGREKLIRPLAAGWFGDLPAPVDETLRALWTPGVLAEESGADLMLVEVHRWLAPRFRDAGWLIVPQSVRWQGALDAIPPVPPSNGLRDNLRKVRKYGYTLEQAGTPKDWDDFYRRMVLPQAMARHGRTAWIPSPQYIAALARIGILHLVMRAGEAVAGICSVRRGDSLWLPLSGVRDGNPELLQQGAGFATLALTIAWAKSQGLRHLDTGRSMPFVNDGVQRLKRSLGLLPAVDPLAHVVAMWVGSDSARRALAREPVLVEHRSGIQTFSGE